MTSEVCLMNRLAVVIAADSATTVTHWTERGSEERYFKGANKIFQLSDHHPIGLMIFDSADIMRVPWEIVVKAFRHELAKKSFNSLGEYAAEFFSFLEQSPRLFPPEIQKAVFLDNARSAAIRMTLRQTLEEVEADRLAMNDKLVATRRVELENQALPPNIDQAHVDQTIAQWREDLVKLLDEWKEAFGATYPTDLANYADLGMLEVFKDPGKQMGKTGLVFAGFGDHDIFPAFCEFRSCGIVAGKHVAFEVKQVAITHETPAWLDSFAQTDMSDTFSMGISRDVYGSVMNTMNDGLNEFAKIIAAAVGTDVVPDLPAKVSAALGAMGESIFVAASGSVF